MSEKKQIILVPTDFSDAANTAINHAATVASVSGDEIRLLHIVNKDTKSKLKKAGESLDDLNAKMDGLVADLKSKYGVKADSHLREGSIFTTIGEVAEEIGARLLVMGTHGVIGMQHITGAWAVKVITSSPVPVIIVQKKALASHGYKTIVFPIDASRHPSRASTWSTTWFSTFWRQRISTAATATSASFLDKILRADQAAALEGSRSRKPNSRFPRHYYYNPNHGRQHTQYRSRSQELRSDVGRTDGSRTNRNNGARPLVWWSNNNVNMTSHHRHQGRGFYVSQCSGARS